MVVLAPRRALTVSPLVCPCVSGATDAAGQVLRRVREQIYNKLVHSYSRESDRTGRASPPHYQAEPEITLRANVEVTRKLLRLAEETGSRVIHASSSEVYGNI
jgi:hypothetical protein